MRYQKYDELVERIKSFPNHQSLGKDASGQYDIWSIELGERWKPTLFFTSSLHGSEWQTTNYGLSFFERVLNGDYNDNDIVKRMLSDFHIFYIPIANPYGLDNVTNPYKQYDNKSRRNANDVDLNRDFTNITQAESIIIADVVNELKPFAALDMHMFQSEYDLSGGRNMILGGSNLGVREVNEIRDKTALIWETKTNEPVHIWTVRPGEGLLRRFIAEQSNEYTPNNLAYISEMVRPTEINGEIIRLLSDEQIYNYGIEGILAFSQTSIEYYDKYRHIQDDNDVMYVKDLSGNEYVLQATSTNEGELNGNQSFSATIYATKVNKLFINDITEMWTVTDHDGVEHKIIYCRKKGEGNSLAVEIKAVPLFFDDLDNNRIYEEYNDHMTAQRCFTLIFEDTNYNFILVDHFDAVQWEGFGAGESKLETFKRALNRYKAEFKIVGNTIYLEKQIGRDTQFQYRYKLNASNIEKEIDANEFWTYARGYGNYGDGEGGEDWKNAKLKREYTSPLAKIPQIGIRHAPPIKNGNITSRETMDEALKTLVDESLKISVSADIHDLRKQGYPLAQPELGDRSFILDERIDLNEEVRVIHKTITRDWKGNVIDLNLTFGTEGITKRYQSNMKTAINQITDIMEGKRKLPYSVVDNAILKATEALRDAQTQLQFGSNGILAIDKNNPNYVTIFNSAGIGVSTDGGATFRNAITGHGINADLILVGTLAADRVGAGELVGNTIRTSSRTDNYIHLQNQMLRFWNSSLEKMKLGFYWSELYDQYNPYIVIGAGFGTNKDLDQMVIRKMPERLRFEYKRPDGQNIWLSFRGDTDVPYLSLNQPLSVSNLWMDVTNFGKHNKTKVKAFETQTQYCHTDNSFIRIKDGGTVEFVANGEIQHRFNDDGTKDAGTIKLDGVNYGMSPIDSPQTLIEYIEFNVEVSEFGTEIELDDKYRKSVENYAIFPSDSNIKIIDKQHDKFTLKGTGTVDIRIVGIRKGYSESFWGDMDHVG